MSHELVVQGALAGAVTILSKVTEFVTQSENNDHQRRMEQIGLLGEVERCRMQAEIMQAYTAAQFAHANQTLSLENEKLKLIAKGLEAATHLIASQCASLMTEKPRWVELQVIGTKAQQIGARRRIGEIDHRTTLLIMLQMDANAQAHIFARPLGLTLKLPAPPAVSALPALPPPLALR